MPTIFGIFFTLLYFLRSNSNIEAYIGLIALQTCLFQSKYLRCFSSLFWNFYFCSFEKGIPKTIVHLTEI